MEQVFDDFLGNAPWRWLVAGGVAFAILFVLLLLRRIARKQFARMAATPQDELLEVPLHVASRTTVSFLVIAALFAGLQTLEMAPKAARVALTLFTIACFWQVGLERQHQFAIVTAWLSRRENNIVIKAPCYTLQAPQVCSKEGHIWLIIQRIKAILAQRRCQLLNAL